MGRLKLISNGMQLQGNRKKIKRTVYSWVNDTDMLVGIIIELTKIEDIAQVTREKVLCWVKRVEVQSPVCHNEQPH